MMQAARRAPLRYGMVGGGPGAFIGAVHRRALAVDGLATLVAGAFSSDAERSRAHGAELGLDSRRTYDSFEGMAEAEAALPADERIDFVVIVTPNHLHCTVARAFVERGINVVCDKPLATSLADAEVLRDLVRERGVLFGLTHNYTGYPLVKQARALVHAGALGGIRRVIVEYVQDWLATPLERSGHRQAEWRTDPARAGAGALGDIGTHAHSLVRYITGLEVERLHADVATFVPGRRVEDDASLLVHYTGGARGVLSCSQVATGAENDLRIRVHGTDGALDWSQEQPNTLRFHRDGATQVITRASAGLAPAAQRACRLPPGHPEGFLEAFANLYAGMVATMRARAAGVAPDPLDLDFPTIDDGVAGVHFIETALRSAREGVWLDARYGAGEARAAGPFDTSTT